MKVFVFVGPTLPLAEARAILDATYLPPVGQGDVYRVMREKPDALGIIDGVFEQVPAVWHKEILWALACGIHVFGSASMGALRAAELAPFGMEGVGPIFRAFQSGDLEDDDEVAVAHGEASQDFRATSEAMVNVRASLRAAQAAGVLDEGVRAQMEGIAKGLYYADRSYPALLAAAAACGVPPAVLDRLHQFLRSGQVSQKRLDALEMLRVMAARGPALATKRPVTFKFEHTDTWDQVVSSWDAGPGPVLATERMKPDRSLLPEELRLRGPLFAAIQHGAMLRALAEHAAARDGVVVPPALQREIQESFRRERGLENTDATFKWCADNELDEAGFGRLIESEARLRWLKTVYGGEGRRHFHAELVASGEYPSILARARHKQEILAGRGLAEPTLADAGLTEAQLHRWFFEERLGRPQPDDLLAYVRECDLASVEDLRREALRERLYLQLTSKADQPG